MKLCLESDHVTDYLKSEPPVIVWDTPMVRNTIECIKQRASTRRERARFAFEVARDQVSHSFDNRKLTVSVGAEDTLCNEHGICFAKAHLLASLLRGMDIPCGFCYQRVTRKGTIDSGYALHGLNALFLEGTGWFRVDPRGNKPGIDSQFSTDVEQLAYSIRTDLGELDYPHVFTSPLPAVIDSMRTSRDTEELFYKRPSDL